MKYFKVVVNKVLGSINDRTHNKQIVGHTCMYSKTMLFMVVEREFILKYMKLFSLLG